MEICERCLKPIEKAEEHGLYICPLEARGSAPGIGTDDIPGGLVIRHGLVGPNGEPRKFYSKTDIKRAANEAGLTQGYDSPRPYKVSWSGRRRDGQND